MRSRAEGMGGMVWWDGIKGMEGMEGMGGMEGTEGMEGMERMVGDGIGETEGSSLMRLAACNKSINPLKHAQY
eukprot:491165-Prorocentrum_minimum.AAC.2